MTARVDSPSRDCRLSVAELLAVTAVVFLATLLTAAYLLDRSGFGLAPWAAVAFGAIAATLPLAALRHTNRRAIADTFAFLLIAAGSLAYLLWLAWPALLPLGSGSDLTHHLILVDYAERHGQLPHDASAVEYLGEMADYTPGLHLVAAVAGAITRTNGFHAIYPVVAIATALKFAIFFLVLLRLLADSPVRLAMSMAGTIAVLTASTYSLGSFVEDSFLAQALSELFAVAAWWAVVWWDDEPTFAAMAFFASAGIATFLTWPIWIGPPVVALALVCWLQRDLPWPARISHGLVALIPIGMVAALHTFGRAGQVGIVSTSGAVVPPSPAVLGWWLPLLSLCGAFVAIARRRQRPAVAFAVAIAAQAAALWLVAAGRTPYMAIKMTYLAIYPAIAFATVFTEAVARLVGSRVPPLHERRAVLALAWLAVVAVTVVARRDVPVRAKMRPVVSNELFDAGQWARTHVPVGCVDYLVGNEYTAYWLHLAVLGNPRISSRTGDDNTFLTQPSMARWLVPGAPQYAIANLSILPAEIRSDVHILQQFGQAAVIARRGPASCP